MELPFIWRSERLKMMSLTKAWLMQNRIEKNQIERHLAWYWLNAGTWHWLIVTIETKADFRREPHFGVYSDLRLGYFISQAYREDNVTNYLILKFKGKTILKYVQKTHWPYYYLHLDFSSQPFLQAKLNFNYCKYKSNK